jgi:hypothetical protein
MPVVDLVARKFAAALGDPKFREEPGEPYVNDYGVSGWRYSGNLAGRIFYICESKTEKPTAPGKVARIISNPEHIDRNKTVVYVNRNSQPGVRVEAWYCGRWFQVFTPNVPGQPTDDFFSDVPYRYPAA